MGTDIFLKWDRMSQDERVAQTSASRSFMMDAGKYGYLRAAIGMKRENALLRSIFPADYWYNKTGNAIRFDFRAGLPVLDSAAKIYIRSVEEGTVPGFKDYALVAMMDRVSNERAAKAGFQKVSATEDLGFGEAKLWLQELAEFFQLGTKKQDAGLNPGIYIGW